MPQGSLFVPSSRAFVINIDGASRGNPGPAAAGWVVRDADKAANAALDEHKRTYRTKAAVPEEP